LIYDPVENRGRHTHRGSHSSYNSKRKYLSDAYLEKSSILEERSQRHNSRGSDGHRGSMFKRGEIIQWKQDRESSPKESSSKGSIPKRRMALFHWCQRGRDSHIDVIDVY
jgi:hypothetical protein